MKRKKILIEELMDFIHCPYYYDFMKKEDKYFLNPKTSKITIYLSFGLSFILFIYGLVTTIKLILNIFF